MKARTRVMRFRIVAVLAVGVLLLLTAGGGTGRIAPADGRSSGATTSLSVMAVADYHFSPSTIEEVATNATINVTFYDADTQAHTFTIWSRQGVVIPTSTNPQQLDQLLAEYPPLVSIVLNGAGQQNSTTFRSPATAGWYEFVCAESGHFQFGQFGFIAFGENLPSNLSPPSRVGVGGLSLTPLDELSLGGLVGGFAVVAVIWWRRRRSRPTLT